MAYHFWQRGLHNKGTAAFILLLLGLAGCKDFFTCKDTPVGPDPGSGPGAFAVAKIARWDGNLWHSLGKGVTSIDVGFTAVNDLVIHEDLVYVGGVFDFAGEYEVNSIARWSGNAWQGFGNLELPGVHREFPTDKGAVNAIAITGSGAGATMFVAGDFQMVFNDVEEELNAHNLAFFDFGSSLWRTMGEGVNGNANALANTANTLYVAGAFEFANNLPNTNLIAQWNLGSGRWAAVGTGLYGVAVHAMLVNGNDLFVGGQFHLAGETPVNNVAKWDGVRWSPLGSGLNGTVYDLAWWGNELYAAGQFFTASYERFHALARWREGAWTLLGDQIAPGGSGESYRIKGLALAAGGNSIFLGGRFDQMGGQPVYHVARWDRERWLDLTGGAHEIGETLLSGVKALSISGTDIFAGGTFSSVGKQQE